MAVVWGPVTAHGTERGAVAGATLNDDFRDTNAGTAPVESTDPQKSPASTKRFVALRETESSIAWWPNATVTGEIGVQSHWPGDGPAKARRADCVAAPSFPRIQTSRPAHLPPTDDPLNIIS